MPVTYDQVLDIAWRLAEQHGAEADLTRFHFVHEWGATVMFSFGRSCRVINVAFDFTTPQELEADLRRYLLDWHEFSAMIPSRPSLAPKKTLTKKPKPAPTAWEWIDREELE